MKLKSIFFSTLLFIFVKFTYSQIYEISRTGADETYKAINTGVNNLDLGNTLPSFFIKADQDNQKIDFGGNQVSFGISPSKYEIDGVSDFYAREFTITKSDGTKFIFSINKSSNNVPGSGNTPISPTNSTQTKNILPATSIYQEIGKKYGISSPVTNRGLEVYAGGDFTGNSYSHIFLDQYGNTVLSTIPQGIANRKYVVHVFYLVEKEAISDVRYSVVKTKGSFNSSLVFFNDNQIPTGLTESGGVDNTIRTKTYVWKEDVFLIDGASNDIEFEVYRNDAKGQVFNANKTKLATHTIKMTKVYHGSFEVGLLNSDLENPTFQLLPLNATDSTVKKSDGGNRGVVTAMATLYSSPIVVIRKLFGGRVLDHQLFGRSYFDDHKIYERIYPTIGVKLGDNAFENLFYGFNWEFARGGNIFVGWHYGKVNTFEQDDFEFGVDSMNETEFNLSTNSSWETEFAIGFNLDVRIIGNLFGGTTTSN